MGGGEGRGGDAPAGGVGGSCGTWLFRTGGSVWSVGSGGFVGPGGTLSGTWSGGSVGLGGTLSGTRSGGSVGPGGTRFWANPGVG